MKTYVVGTHKKHLSEALLMSTTAYVFVSEKYQHFWIEKSAFTRAMIIVKNSQKVLLRENAVMESRMVNKAK